MAPASGRQRERSDDDSDGSARPISKPDVERLLFVALAGAAGGALFWLLAIWSGTTTFGTWPWEGQLAALMFIGAIAGLFGVYLLTSSNLNSMRTYVFAIVCGLVWQPIINTAKQSVTNASVTRQTAAVNTQTEQLKTVAVHGSEQDVTTAVNSTAPKVTASIGQLADVQDATKKQEIVDNSKKAIAVFEDASAKAPDSSIQAIQKVGIAAGKANQTEVGMQAVQSLRAIGVAARQPGVALKSAESLKVLAATSQDPVVKKAAEISLRDLETARNSR
jgi:hypothetical protein